MGPSWVRAHGLIFGKVYIVWVCAPGYRPLSCRRSRIRDNRTWKFGPKWPKKMAGKKWPEKNLFFLLLTGILWTKIHSFFIFDRDFIKKSTFFYFWPGFYPKKSFFFYFWPGFYQKNLIFFYFWPGFYQTNQLFLLLTGVLSKKSFFFNFERDFIKKIRPWLAMAGHGQS